MTDQITITDEQFALLYYLEHGNPGPVLRQIATDRIMFLERNKSGIKRKYLPASDSSDHNFYSRNNITLQ